MPRTGVCKPLMPNVVASKPHKNNHSYVSSADLPSDSLCKNLACWAEDLEKPQNCQNWGVGTWLGMGACLVQYCISNFCIFSERTPS